MVDCDLHSILAHINIFDVVIFKKRMTKAHKITCPICLMSNKNTDGLDVRHTFRASHELSNTFNSIVELGGFNRSAVMRSLLTEWIERNSEILGAEK